MVRFLYRRRPSMKYDVIVVGGGSAGCTIASRLSEDPDRSVLLLEAGPDYPVFEHLPDDLQMGNNVWLSAYGPHNWGYTAKITEDQTELVIPRGKATGGSSAVNGQVLFRGIPEGLRPVGGMGQRRVELHQRAAVLQQAGDGPGLWRRRLPRFRRAGFPCAGRRVTNGCLTRRRSSGRAWTRDSHGTRTRTIRSRRECPRGRETPSMACG